MNCLKYEVKTCVFFVWGKTKCTEMWNWKQAKVKDQNTEHIHYHVVWLAWLILKQSYERYCKCPKFN